MTDTSLTGAVIGDWLPAEWAHPERAVPAPGFHLRPIRATDVDLDLVAVLGSRDRLWRIFGRAWNWPPTDLTREQDLAQLRRHEAEHAAHESFTYALFDAPESRLLGCVYVDPPGRPGADAEVSWWVVDALAGTNVERALEVFVPAWISADWPLREPRFVGRDLTWDQWLGLPENGTGR